MVLQISIIGSYEKRGLLSREDVAAKNLSNKLGQIRVTRGCRPTMHVMSSQPLGVNYMKLEAS